MEVGSTVRRRRDRGQRVDALATIIDGVSYTSASENDVYLTTFWDVFKFPRSRYINDTSFCGKSSGLNRKRDFTDKEESTHERRSVL